MKHCDYCANEIGYNEQYCCSECEKESLAYYAREKRSEKIVSVVNLISVFGLIGVTIAAVTFAAKTSCLIGAALVLILGITYLIFPFAPESIIKKYKIKKSIKLIRSFAVVLLVASAVLFIVGLFVL